MKLDKGGHYTNIPVFGVNQQPLSNADQEGCVLGQVSASLNMHVATALVKEQSLHI